MRLKKEARPESITAGGKNENGIKTQRLQAQRDALARQLAGLAESARSLPQFDGRVVVYACMFEDSLAPTWTPSDLFEDELGGQLIAPYKFGYLVEVEAENLQAYSHRVARTDRTRVLVDISRVQSVSFFGGDHATESRSLADLWQSAPKTENGRAFVVWLMPFRDSGAAEELIRTFANMRGEVVMSAPRLLASIRGDLTENVPAVLRRTLQTAASDGDRIGMALREYRQKGRSRATVVLASEEALEKIVASGTVFRIEPVKAVASTAPGEGPEPIRPLPSHMSNLPTVGVVDGGLTASSYQSAVAWRAPALIKDGHADSKHGNLVTSLIVQGHDWNNKLTLPPLYCRVGVAQAVARVGGPMFADTQDLIVYLDGLMTAYPETRVWNFSLNQRESCAPDRVSDLGHDLAVLARKHRVLPIISIGNKPGDRLQPPADCEAAITVGGRLHKADGAPGGICPISHCGPGPSSMLKPELSNFSHVRALGGTVVQGSSFGTALTSPLAAHTMMRLRDASPDLVKALLLHNADGETFNPAIGFGTPVQETMPWEARPGYVTLQWTANLRPGAAFYWELPIPPSLRKTGKLRGTGVLTAILNPHPMVTDYAGPNYFSVRLATALQVQRGVTPKLKPKFANLLGSLETDKIQEQAARQLDHKWSPVRRHHKTFRNVQFDGDALRVYARVYSRDLYQYDYASSEEIPEMEVVFVLSLGTGDPEDDVYNELRDQLGTFVEAATIETDIDLEFDSEF